MITDVNATPKNEFVYCFDEFRFFPQKQLLLRGDEPVRIGTKALSILLVLLQRAGDAVSKGELMQLVWPDKDVSDGNLKVHIAALRQALSDGARTSQYIATVNGLGYRFIATVITPHQQDTHHPLTPGSSGSFEIVGQMPTGRGDDIANLLAALEHHRVITVVGPGGIGKSTVGASVAATYSRHAGLSTCTVDFSVILDENLVANTMASALGLDLGDGMMALSTILQESGTLLVLDSCEHIIDSVAKLVVDITKSVPSIRIVCTSREPLRIAGEFVFRVPPLTYPADEASLDASRALGYSAVQLFAKRASECVVGYRVTDADAQAVADICRRLEGVPLAIELAAMRMDALGVSEIALHLGDRFQLLKRGRRDSVARHKTLAATLDWSYALLPEVEKTIFRRLSAFTGDFTVTAALELLNSIEGGRDSTIEGLASLVEKSMVVKHSSGSDIFYRLLNITRAFAAVKSDELGENHVAVKRPALS